MPTTASKLLNGFPYEQCDCPAASVPKPPERTRNPEEFQLVNLLS
jgi:hypothetical protein